MGPGKGVGGGGEGCGEEAGGGLEGGGKGEGAGQEVIVPYVPERPVAWKVHTEAACKMYASSPEFALLPEKLVVAMDVVPKEAYIPPPYNTKQTLSRDEPSRIERRALQQFLGAFLHW